MTTSQQYDDVLAACREIFRLKTRDYGTSWRILRLPSLTDQIYIKAQRIRTLEQTGVARVDEGIDGELQAIVNYSIMALIQIDLGEDGSVDLDPDRALELYDARATETKDLMLAKNHDYGEAWRSMRTSSFTDLILTKLHRIKQIEDNAGQTLVSEGTDGHYRDILNYAVFALIRRGERNDGSSD